MNKTTEALAVKALEMIAGERMCLNNLLSDKDIAREALAAIREVLADHVEQNLTMVADHSGDANEMVAPEGYALISIDALKAWGKYDVVHNACQFSVEQEPKCNPHPDAPHGFDRNASHSADRYVCECECWEPDEPAQILPGGGLVGKAEPVKRPQNCGTGYCSCSYHRI